MVRLENVSTIKNKLKRREVWSKVKADKKKAKKQARKLRDKEVEELGEEARVKQVGPLLDGCRSRNGFTAPHVHHRLTTGVRNEGLCIPRI